MSATHTTTDRPYSTRISASPGPSIILPHVTLIREHRKTDVFYKTHRCRSYIAGNTTTTEGSTFFFPPSIFLCIFSRKPCDAHTPVLHALNPSVCRLVCALDSFCTMVSVFENEGGEKRNKHETVHRQNSYKLGTDPAKSGRQPACYNFGSRTRTPWAS